MDKLALRGFAVRMKNMLGTVGSDDIAFAWFSRLLALRYMTANGIVGSGLFSMSFASDAEAAARAYEDLAVPGEMFPEIFGDDMRRYAVPDNISEIISLFGSRLPDDVLYKNVQMIGWLYQFYNAEEKHRGNGTLKRSGRLTPEKIPSATQIFTPDWIVKYMVENTLGRLWTETHDHCGNWEYLAECAEHGDISRNPEGITFIDPCMGCGNILVYAFDVFIDIYRSCGYDDDKAAELIIRRNLYGLDIDRPAYTLAVFSLIMKAAEYSPSILRNGIVPNLAEFRTVSDKMRDSDDDELKNCHIYGSLIQKSRRKEKLWDILTRQYDVVVTNPPYMSVSTMEPNLLSYIRKNYSDYSADLFSAFLYRCGMFTKNGGYSGFLTPYVWMFIQSYEKLRRHIFSTNTIETLVQFEYSSFRDATVPVCMFTMKKDGMRRSGIYIKLSDFKGDMDVQRERTVAALTDRKCGYVYEADSSIFEMIPDAPVAYWVSPKIAGLYRDCPSLGTYVSPRKGCSTSDNDRFLRRWFEVDKHKINVGCTELRHEDTMEKYWFPYNKGGGYRKWYGFNSYLINWYDDGAAIRDIPSSVIANYKYFMKPGLTWSTLTSGSFSIRSFGEGYIFDNGGCCIFDLDEKKDYFCALLNSKVFSCIFGQLNPTLNFQSGDVAKFPVIYCPDSRIDELAEECIALSKEEYDCFETSFDFRRHPLI
ncbi:MAG: N-6 DNA methylase [Ruminococcus sp.]|nr:N-6 DNA methylase [Ruminococcus sp.]